MEINCKRSEGFTLIEVMIALAIIGIIIGTAYSVVNSQRKASTTQSEVMAMQQSLRAAMYYIEREIRLAGYPGHASLSPTSGRVPGTGILEAGHGHIRIAMDIFDRLDNNGNGVIDEWNEDETASPGASFRDGLVTAWNEDITYGFAPTYDGLGTGLVSAVASPAGTDPGAAPLGRADHNYPTPAVAPLVYSDLADSIQAIGFAYAYDDDNNGILDFKDTNANGTQDVGEPTYWAADSNGDGLLDKSLDTNEDGNIDGSDAVGGAAMVTPVSIDKIRAVKVWILARTKHPIPGHRDTKTHIVGDKHITPNDGYWRELLTATIRCRNMN